MKINEEWKIDNNKYACPYCEKIFYRAGICSHIICKHTEKGRERVEKNKKLHSIRMNGHKSWNKGLTKEIDARVNQCSKTYKERKYIPWNKNKKNIFNKDVLRKISSKMKEIAKTRVSSKGIGRAFKGYYKEFWCDRQWELAFVIYCLDHNIKRKRCEECFEYVYDNEIHLYHPDFIINDNEYIEIKGYQSKKDDAKFNDFPKDKILNAYHYKELKDIFEYILNHYQLKQINDIHTLYTKEYNKIVRR